MRAGRAGGFDGFSGSSEATARRSNDVVRLQLKQPGGKKPKGSHISSGRRKAMEESARKRREKAAAAAGGGGGGGGAPSPRAAAAKAAPKADDGGGEPGSDSVAAVADPTKPRKEEEVRLGRPLTQEESIARLVQMKKEQQEEQVRDNVFLAAPFNAEKPEHLPNVGKKKLSRKSNAGCVRLEDSENESGQARRQRERAFPVRACGEVSEGMRQPEQPPGGADGQACGAAAQGAGGPVTAGEKTSLFAPFIYKSDHFAKTGSGQT